MKRIFDFCLSLIGIVLLMPFFIIISLLIMIESKGSPIYLQNRVGKNQKIFKIVKFRTMYLNAEKQGLLTIGNQDERITKVGFFLRKYKLDEFLQLFNVLIGQMSFVGPRPEIPHFTKFYSEEQKKVFSVKPGITDYASIKYRNESEILANVDDPYQFYLDTILPDKLKMNIEYIQRQSVYSDIKIICLTLLKLITK